MTRRPVVVELRRASDLDATVAAGRAVPTGITAG